MEKTSVSHKEGQMGLLPIRLFDIDTSISTLSARVKRKQNV